MFRNSPIYGSNALEISQQSDQKRNLQSGTNLCVLKSTIISTAWNWETPVHFFVQLCRQNDWSDNYKHFSSFESSTGCVLISPAYQNKFWSGPNSPVPITCRSLSYLYILAKLISVAAVDNWGPISSCILFCLFIPKHLFAYCNLSPWSINQTINQDQLTINEWINQSINKPISQNQSSINQLINQSILYVNGQQINRSFSQSTIDR